MSPPSLPPLAAAAALLCFLAARGQQPEPPAPAAQEPPVERPAQAAPERDARGVTRERVLARLEAIARAAERIAQLDESEESRAVAQSVAALAASLGQELRAPATTETTTETTPVAGRDEAEAELPETSGRVGPAQWTPVGTRTRLEGEWGFSLEQLDPGGTSDRSLVGVSFRALAADGAVLGTLVEPHRNVTFQDCTWSGAPGVDGRPRARYGVRAFDVVDWRFLHCEWRELDGEQAVHLSAPGSVLWRRCRFEDLGGQAIQVGFREDPGATSDPGLRRVGGLHHVVESLFLEVGQPTGGRPGYTLAFTEGPLCAVRVERCFLQTLDAPHLDERGLPANSYGALLVRDRPRVELIDTYIHHRRPDREVVRIWNVDEVVIQGCDIPEGVIELRNCGRVRIAGNRGGATVRVGTGPLHQRALASTKYEGPLPQDFEQ